MVISFQGVSALLECFNIHPNTNAKKEESRRQSKFMDFLTEILTEKLGSLQVDM